MAYLTTASSLASSGKTHLIPRESWRTREWMGGCPSAQSLIAYSQLMQIDLVLMLPCRRWGCPHCGIVRASDLSRRIVEAKPNKFITLTVANSLFESPRHAYDETRRRLPKWSAMVRKKLGNFEYVRILEVTRLGYPHYHLLARCKYISQDTISKMWDGLTGAPLVDIRQIRPGQNSVNYCCKYLRKQAYCAFTSRRVSWTSHFFDASPKVKRDDWKLVQKEHRLAHPTDVIVEQWGRDLISKLGPYCYCRTNDLPIGHPLRALP